MTDQTLPHAAPQPEADAQERSSLPRRVLSKLSAVLDRFLLAVMAPMSSLSDWVYRHTAWIRNSLDEALTSAAGLARRVGDPVYRASAPIRRGVRATLGTALKWTEPDWAQLRATWFPTVVILLIYLGLTTPQGYEILSTVNGSLLYTSFLLVVLAVFCLAAWYFSTISLPLQPDAEATSESKLDKQEAAEVRFPDLRQARRLMGTSLALVVAILCLYFLIPVLGIIPSLVIYFLLLARSLRLRYWAPTLVGTSPALAVAILCLFKDRWGLGIASLVLYFFLLLLIYRCRSTLERLFGSASLDAKCQRLGWLLLWLTLAFVLIIFISLPYGFSRVTVPSWLGTVPMVLLSGAIWIAVITVLFIMPARMAAPMPARRYSLSPPLFVLVLLLPLLFNFLGYTDNHGLTREPTAPLASSNDRPLPADHFQQWLEARKEATAGEPYPVVFVAAEGGGIRAAYWTAALLARLEDRNPGFFCHLYAISGVSGGSLGAAVFTGLIYDRLAQKNKKAIDCSKERITPAESGEVGPLEKMATDALDEDFLAPAVAGLLFPDLLQRFVPTALVELPDRQSYLEQAWEVAWEKAITEGDGSKSELFESNFLSLWENENRVFVPSLLLNATEVDSGGRSIVSNLQIDKRHFIDASDMLTRLPDAHPGIRLSTAAGLSARFTYLSPAATIETRDKRRIRLVDGGYFENSGTLTLRQLLDETFSLCGPPNGGLYECGGRTIKPLVLLIRNSTVEGESRIAGEDGWLDESVQPIKAVLRTREARGRHDSESLTRLTSRACPVRVDLPPPGEEGACRNGVNTVPLGWLLAETTREYMNCQVKDRADYVRAHLAAAASCWSQP